MELLFSVLKIGALVYLGLCLLVYLRQEGMIFLGTQTPPSHYEALRREFPEAELSVQTPDGIRLQGWFLPSKGESSAPLLLYFGGNAEEVGYQLRQRDLFPGHALLLMNYRGFGQSEGTPSQDALVRDALFLYDRFSDRAGIDPERIRVMGRSLGSGVAVQLAAVRPIEKVVLVSPYLSLKSLARDVYPWLPTSLLLRHPFDSAALAPTIDAPLLAVYAGQDGVIPPEQSRSLVERWKGSVRTLCVEGADHNSLDLSPAYGEAVRQFLSD